MVDSGDLDLPVPGGGNTHARWRALAALAEHDLCLARLAEAHVDALAILAELGHPTPPHGSRWGVWASRQRTTDVNARFEGEQWLLSGVKLWCSGARTCTDALVTASAPDGYRLFAVSVAVAPGVVVKPGRWSAAGMAASDNLEVEFTGVPAVAIGDPGDYLVRPGFWQGAIAVAACWYGGAVGLARALVIAGAERELSPHALVHLGAIDTSLVSLAASFTDAAEAIDADPTDKQLEGERRAGRVRAETEKVASEVLQRVGRALGAGPLCRDARLAALAADLPVYMLQSHAESDLARLGALAVRDGVSW